MLMMRMAGHIENRLTSADLRFHTAHTRYAVVDDLLPEDMAHQIANAFPEDAAGFSRRKSFRERKFASNDFDSHPPILKQVAYALQDQGVVETIERAFGSSKLVADPTCYAGGLSIMGSGDFLNPHIDNSHNGARTLYRRINLLYYCTPGWRQGDGGELELWSRSVSRKHCIRPSFNRLVLMETNRTSWHSVAPIRHGQRRCVSSYYFSEASPDGTDYYHVTSFNGRPKQRLQRLIAPFDNGARQFARTRLHLGRQTDRGYVAISP